MNLWKPQCSRKPGDAQALKTFVRPVSMFPLLVEKPGIDKYFTFSERVQHEVFNSYFYPSLTS